MNNRDRLIDLMIEHGLERHDVARLVHVSRDTVDRWLLPVESRQREPVPEMAVELLALKLEREAAGRDAGPAGASGEAG